MCWPMGLLGTTDPSGRGGCVLEGVVAAVTPGTVWAIGLFGLISPPGFCFASAIVCVVAWVCILVAGGVGRSNTCGETHVRGVHGVMLNCSV